jgi:hypothetical protein
MIYREEFESCVELGIKMGLNVSAIKAVLDVFVTYPSNFIPYEDFRKIFKRYEN